MILNLDLENNGMAITEGRELITVGATGLKNAMEYNLPKKLRCVSIKNISSPVHLHVAVIGT
jgi:hypothetical protein